MFVSHHLWLQAHVDARATEGLRRREEHLDGDEHLTVPQHRHFRIKILAWFSGMEVKVVAGVRE